MRFGSIALIQSFLDCWHRDLLQAIGNAWLLLWRWSRIERSHLHTNSTIVDRLRWIPLLKLSICTTGLLYRQRRGEISRNVVALRSPMQVTAAKLCSTPRLRLRLRCLIGQIRSCFLMQATHWARLGLAVKWDVVGHPGWWGKDGLLCGLLRSAHSRSIRWLARLWMQSAAWFQLDQLRMRRGCSIIACAHELVLLRSCAGLAFRTRWFNFLRAFGWHDLVFKARL